jgi:hypothetical protein
VADDYDAWLAAKMLKSMLSTFPLAFKSVGFQEFHWPPLYALVIAAFIVAKGEELQ